MQNRPTISKVIKTSKEIFIGEVIGIKSIGTFTFQSRWSAKLESKTLRQVFDVIKGSDRNQPLVDFGYKPVINVKIIIFINHVFSYFKAVA